MMFIKWYNPATSAWEDIPTSVDPAARTASARITHTSVFALFAENPTTVLPTSPPTTPAPPLFSGLSFLWIAAAIVVVIVAVAVIIFIIMRRRWSNGKEPADDEKWKME
jgi:heme/copper-type cytochrome/quinol oxidase subunit 2